MLVPPGGEGNGEACFRATWGEGGPLLLSTGKPCHGEQNCSERLREEARGRRWRGSDTSSRFEGTRPVICLQPHLSYHQLCFFLGGSFYHPLLCSFSVCPWERDRPGGGERKRTNLVISVEPSLAKPTVAMFEFSPTEQCTFWNSPSWKPLWNS